MPRPRRRAVEAGARVALEDAGGRAGDLRIRLRDVSTTKRGELSWDPELVNANADRAADDPRAIAYLGELGHGASAISMPTLNDAGLLQVSPEDGLTSLTTTPPGRPRSLPERLWPSGRRNFVRVVPRDLLQAETLVDLLGERGAERPVVVFDQEVYGRELAAQIISQAAPRRQSSAAVGGVPGQGRRDPRHRRQPGQGRAGLDRLRRASPAPARGG